MPLVSRLTFVAIVIISTEVLSFASVITPDSSVPVNTGGAFAYTNINLGVSDSLYAGSDIRDLFGGNFSTLGGPGIVIFYNTGSLDYTVNFAANAPLPLTGYSVSFMEDGGGQGYRATSEFKLFADGVLLSDVHLLSLGQSYTGVYGSNVVTLSSSFSQVLATNFRVVFSVDSPLTESPRLVGLSGFPVPIPGPVPEPGLAGLAGLVCLAFVLLAKSRAAAH